MNYKIADIKLADFGRKEITLAEKEMPGLMAVRKEYAGKELTQRTQEVQVHGSNPSQVQCLVQDIGERFHIPR